MNRTKRGIHIIFGDLPELDYRNIQEALRNVHTNENLLTNKINEQISINNEMINRFREIENAIATENKLATIIIEDFRKATQDMLEVSAFEQFLYTTEYNMDRLQRHLDEILHTITLAKQGYISNYLLTNNESQFIVQQLQNQSITITTEYQLYQFLEINTIFKQPLIIFSISIPKFYKETFTQYYVAPITINQTLSIPIPNHYLIMNDQNFQFSQNPCKNINNEFYCDEQHIQQNTESCIPQIILNIKAVCDLINKPVKNSITQIASQYLIINTNTNIEYNTSCITQRSRYFATITLIKFINCTITVNGTTYKNDMLTFNEELVHLQPFHEIIINNTLTPIEIPHLTNWSITNMDKINELRDISIPKLHHHTYWSLTTIIIMSIIIYLIVWRYCPSCTPCAWYKDIKQSSNTVETEKTESTSIFNTKNARDSILFEGEQLRNDPIITQQCIPIQQCIPMTSTTQ